MDERGPHRRHPQGRPLPRRVGPRRDAQLAQAVAQAMAVRRQRRPDEDAVDHGIVGLFGGHGGARDHREAGRALGTAGRRGRGRTDARVVPQREDLDASVEQVREGLRGGPDRASRIVGRHREAQQQVAERARPRRTHGRGEDDRAGPGRDVAEDRQVLRE